MGLVNLSPKTLGCGLKARLPSALTLKASHSIPKDPYSISLEDNLAKFTKFILSPKFQYLFFHNPQSTFPIHGFQHIPV